MISASPTPPKACPECCASTHEGRLCRFCGRKVSGKKLADLAVVGRAAAQSHQAQQKRSETQPKNEAAKRTWLSAPRSAWLDEKTYVKDIQPRLPSLTISALSSALGVCESYAADIRSGRRRPPSCVGNWKQSHGSDLH